MGAGAASQQICIDYCISISGNLNQEVCQYGFSDTRYCYWQLGPNYIDASDVVCNTANYGPGTFILGPGTEDSFLVEECSFGTTSFSGATSEADCLCNAGYYLPVAVTLQRPDIPRISGNGYWDSKTHWRLGYGNSGSWSATLDLPSGTLVIPWSSDPDPPNLGASMTVHVHGIAVVTFLNDFSNDCNVQGLEGGCFQANWPGPGIITLAATSPINNAWSNGNIPRIEYYPQPNTCVACDAGTYKSADMSNDQGQCIACPAGSTSPVGSTSVENCVCIDGHEDLRRILDTDPMLPLGINLARACGADLNSRCSTTGSARLNNLGINDN